MLKRVNNNWASIDDDPRGVVLSTCEKIKNLFRRLNNAVISQSRAIWLMEKDKKIVYHDPPLIATVFYGRELCVDIKRMFHSCNEIPELFSHSPLFALVTNHRKGIFIL